jgi:hypothetical protein
MWGRFRDVAPNEQDQALNMLALGRHSPQYEGVWLLLDGRSKTPLLSGLFSRCSTQQAVAIVDQPTTTACRLKQRQHECACLNGRLQEVLASAAAFEAQQLLCVQQLGSEVAALAAQSTQVEVCLKGVQVKHYPTCRMPMPAWPSASLSFLLVLVVLLLLVAGAGQCHASPQQSS